MFHNKSSLLFPDFLKNSKFPVFFPDLKMDDQIA